jgi:hypothetical protein
MLVRGTASLLVVCTILLRVCILDLCLMGSCSLLLGLSFPRVISILAVGLLLVQELDLLLLFGFLLLLQFLLHRLLLLVLKLPFSLLTLDDRVAHHLRSQKVDVVVANKVLDGFTAVVNLTQLNEERNQVEQLLVFHIVVP